MNKFGIQLFSVRDYFKSEEGIKEAFSSLSEMGFTSVHTAGTYDFSLPKNSANMPIRAVSKYAEHIMITTKLKTTWRELSVTTKF